MTEPAAVTLTLPADLIDLIVDRVVMQVKSQLDSETRLAGPQSRELTVREAADYLGCSTALIYKMRCDGRLTSHRHGGAGRAWCDRQELDLYKSGERHPATVLASRRTRLRPSRDC